MCFRKCGQCGTELNGTAATTHTCRNARSTTPETLAAIRAALTDLAAEHAARSVGNGLVSDMHLLAEQRTKAYRDHFYPERS